jgi:hypothetical protein
MNFFTLLFNKKKAIGFYLGWQKTVMPNCAHDRIVMNYAQLKSATINQVNSDLRIIKDCFGIVERTTKPDTFFPRMALLVEKSDHLASLKEYADYIGMKHNNFAGIKNSVFQCQNEMVMKFLMRYFTEISDKAEAMKTKAGKIGRYQKWHDSLQEYYCYMSKEHIAYIESKYMMHILSNQ